MSGSPSIAALRSRLDDLALADRSSFERRLAGAARIRSTERAREVRALIAADVERAERRVALRRANAPAAIEYPDDLPITAWREELLETIADHQVVVVAGATGSGKSTQLPKLCLELGRGITGTIGHTQPRRIAARSIAERVADELGVAVGDAVGYTMRFTDEVSEGTLVKVMTDGILLAELQRDPALLAYDTIVLDEAHERSLNIDFLLGYLKRLLPERPDLKVVITSATIDTRRFSEHFDDAPVVEVSGRLYPVEVRYRPLDDPALPEPRDQTEAICDAVAELAQEGTGDVLVFCAGEREIRDAIDAIEDLDLPHTEVLPLFGRLSAAEQHRIFAPHTGRRIVVSTNVAETSLTVPGIRSVVDAGMARISRYSRRTKVQRLPIEPISRASADQRAGRCGRLGPGVCIRLYSEEDYEARPAFTDPEILRTNLASVMLQMAAIGLGDVEDFPFVEPPDARSIRDGAVLLEELGAIGEGTPGTRDWLTDVGRTLARIPVDPRIGRMLVAADERNCLDEVATIAAALSIQDPRERPLGKEQAADERHRRHTHRDSDLLSWLVLWDHVVGEREARTSSGFRRMCRDEFLSWRRVREWQDLRAQLLRVADELGLRRNRTPATPEVVHEALLGGLLSHVGSKDPDSHEYRGARGTRFSIRPGSVLFKRNPPWVMAAELVETARTWAVGVAELDVDTIERVGAHVVTRAISDPWWDAERGAAVSRETVSLYGLPLRSDRIVLAGHHDPVGARDLFIRNALVLGDWETHHAFDARNRDRIAEVLATEARARRGDLLVTEDEMAAFFDERLPADVVSARHFDRWWNQTREDHPHLLDLTEDDLVRPDAGEVDDRAFPRTWAYGDLELPLTYEFDPSSDSDGLTVDVPAGALDRIDPGDFTWTVPGLRGELVESLMRSLPKHHRRRFTPIADTAADVAASLRPEGDVVAALCRELTRRSGEPIVPDDVDPERIPPHLRPRYRVIGDDGAVLAAGDDLAALRDRLVERARSAASGAAHPLERDGITAWDVGELPRSIELGDGAGRVRAYPALVDQGDSVAIRVLATEEEQRREMWPGTRRLLLLHLPSPQRLLRSVLDRHVGLSLVGSPYGTAAEWMEDCLHCALDEIVASAGGPAWDRAGFDRLLGTVRDELADVVDRVGEASGAILDELRRVSRHLDGGTAEAFPDVAADVRAQLDRFVFEGFLTAVGSERLDDVRRYVAAAARRLETVAEHPVRDRERMVTVRTLEADFDRLVEALPFDPAMLDVAWRIQELRVSLFAQSVGVEGPVSPQRVRRAIDSLVTG
ncbi:MAG: ATP-dependent RNA helicase HrpA [Acidimicrobiia bacterium]|nr:ATP-dependent RNA helicase HrpA [Acidimicrobiia bacterium]